MTNKDFDVQGAIKDVNDALKDINKSPANINGGIKDLSKAADELKCNEPPVFDSKKTLCNSIADTIIKTMSPLHTQSIFVTLPVATAALDDAEQKLQDDLAAITNGILISGLKTTLTKGEVEDAIKEVEDARDEFNNGSNPSDPPKAIEKLTKASDDLSCDRGPGLEKTRQDVCNLILESLVAVVNDMKLP